MAIKSQYTTKEITEQIGLSPSWLRRIEKLGLINPAFPKKRGPEGRRYTHEDVVNALRVMALSACGYPPQAASDYAILVKAMQINLKPYYKKAMTRHISGGVYLFRPEDIFPDGDPSNIDWGRMPMLVVEQIHKGLFALGREALKASKAIKEVRRSLQLAASIEQEIDKEFVPAIDTVFSKAREFGLQAEQEGDVPLYRIWWDLALEREPKQ